VFAGLRDGALACDRSIAAERRVRRLAGPGAEKHAAAFRATPDALAEDASR